MSLRRLMGASCWQRRPRRFSAKLIPMPIHHLAGLPPQEQDVLTMVTWTPAPWGICDVLIGRLPMPSLGVATSGVESWSLQMLRLGVKEG